jgi:hypothetical protein
MSTRTVKRLTIALWIALAAYCAFFFWHWYTHRPCADVQGRLIEIPGKDPGTTEKVCEVGP